MVQYRPHKRARVQEQQSVGTLGKPGCPTDFDGPFRSNIRSFLHEFAHGPISTVPALSLPGVRAWTLPLRYERDGALSLYILEESPLQSHSLYCDRCRVLGWAHHPVCQRRYHFIIGSAELEESAGVGKGRKLCLSCNLVVPASTKTCPGCGADATKSKVLEARTHLLHGVIHANGYGHLLRLNGREGGSQSLSGRDIMDLWDRICTMLRARKVSVMDVSTKHNLEFRLFHAVAYGYCWYGRWGYGFGRGSFGISEQQYTRAIKALSSTPLASVMSRSDRKLSSIVDLYRNLSQIPLTTVRDLVRTMMELLHKLGRPFPGGNNNTKDTRSPGPPPFPKVAAAADTVVAAQSHGGGVSSKDRWPAKRQEQAQEALLAVLRATGKSRSGHVWLSREGLRDGARSRIGDTGLLDFVLKGFVDKRVSPAAVVRRRVNPRTRTLEYRLEGWVDAPGQGQTKDFQPSPKAAGAGDRSAVVLAEQPKHSEVVEDLTYVYNRVLERYKPAVIPDAAQIVLDVRQFIKDYQGEFPRDKQEREVVDRSRRRESQSQSQQQQQHFRVLCGLEGEAKDDDGERTIPPELVVLPRSATVGDLKQSVSKAFRDVYLSFDDFIVVSIPALSAAGDEQKLSSLLCAASKSQFSLAVHGRGIDGSSAARRERGPDEWVVDCECGTKDDDGEQMADCDVCGIWQHTRCVGMEDAAAGPAPAPRHFVCNSCCLSDCRFTIASSG